MSLRIAGQRGHRELGLGVTGRGIIDWGKLIQTLLQFASRRGALRAAAERNPSIHSWTSDPLSPACVGHTGEKSEHIS